MSSELRSLLGHFNVNVTMSDEVGSYLSSLSDSEQLRVREEFSLNLKSNNLGVEQFLQSTACDAANDKSARKFFTDAYAYAFEGGEEPYVPDYAAPRPWYPNPKWA